MSKYGIHKDVWRVVVFGREEAPYRIALAASMCPAILGELTEQSEEDSEGFVVWTPYRSLHEAENSMVARECHDRSASVVIRNALAKWAMAQTDPETAIQSLAKWDRKLGVWCAAAVAETVLKYVLVGSIRPRIAIETSRAWVLGRATVQQLRLVQGDIAGGSAEAAAFCVAAGTSLEFTGSSSFLPGYAAFCAASAEEKAIALRSAVYPSVEEMAKSRNLATRRLRPVIADAIINYPTAEAIADSKGVVRSIAAPAAIGVVSGALAVFLSRHR